jgi:WD40 repeat protein
MLVFKAGPRREVEQVAFSPDGSTVATPAGHLGVFLLPATGGKTEQVTLPIPSAGRTTFHPNGTHIYSAHDSLCVVRLSDRTGEQIPLPRWDTLKIGATPDGSALLVGEKTSHTLDANRYESRWVCFPAHGPWEPLWESRFKGSVYSRPMFLPDGKRFMALETRPQTRPHLFTRSVTTGEVLTESNSLAHYLLEATIAPDATLLAGTTGIWIHVYSVAEKLARPREVKNDTRKYFTGIAFHPSGKYLAATSNDKTVKLYDTATWEIARTFTWDIGRMRSIAFSPDGTLAAAGSDKGKVVVWDVDV